MQRSQLLTLLDDELQPWNYKDYSPNGLQIEGKDTIRKIVTGVTASQSLIDAAIASQADAIVVHHGYFWRNEPPVITGIKRTRIKSLLMHDINLIGYHLPLDGHQTLGNNAQLAKRLQWRVEGQVEDGLLWHGSLAESLAGSAFVQHISRTLGREPWSVGPLEREIKRIAWCSGGAQGLFPLAISLGVDAFVSGEISEQCFHMAEESGVLYVSAGHHASERYGVMALGDWLQQQTGIETAYIELNNPV